MTFQIGDAVRFKEAYLFALPDGSEVDLINYVGRVKSIPNATQCGVAFKAGGTCYTVPAYQAWLKPTSEPPPDC